MKHVIFGGDGFVGQHLSADLAAAGEEVVVVDIVRSDHAHYGSVGFIKADVTVPESIAKVPISPDDAVYNLSARMLSPIMPRAKRHEFFWPVNYDGTRNIIEAMAKADANHLVHFTTDMVYGHTHQVPTPESAPTAPLGEYGMSKLATETLAEEWRGKGMSISLFRPRLIIGPGRLGILVKLFKLIDMNLPVPMIGSGRNPYQFISVFDCASAAAAAWRAGFPNAAYNLGSDDPPLIRDLLGDLVKEAGSRSILLPTPGWAVKRTLDLLDLANVPLMDPEQYLIADEVCILDTSAAKRDLGWKPLHGDADMLRASYREYRAGLSGTKGGAGSPVRPSSFPATAIALPAVADPGPVPRPTLLSVEDAKALDVETVREIFASHINPGQLHFMKLLGFDRVLVERAEGMYYELKDGRRILDFFGGFCSVAFGHNHPRIVAARKRFADEQRHEIGMAFMSQYQAAFAKNLAAIAPGDLDFVFFGSSGSEAMEAALKVAEAAQGPERAGVVYAENSFHGKTKGVLAVTDGKLYRHTFKLADNTHRVPFGDIAAMRAVFESDPSIGIVVLETIQGGAGIIEAPVGYWTALRALCDEFGVLWVADEVQCGVGRTGRFFAFEYEGAIPDVTALAKSLGGSKTAMAAMIARRPVYMKAYGTPKTAMIHAPATFGGIGEAVITAIEALDVLYDEDLIGNAAREGAYIKEGLEALKAKYPALIKDVRGRGLMIGLELQDISQTLPVGAKQMVAMLDDRLKGSLVGFIGALLFKDYDILVAFTEYNRNVIRLEPPLIVSRADSDRLLAALDDLLSRGVMRIVKDYIRLATSRS